MQVTFRLAGLDGEATEDRVETVEDDGSKENLKFDLLDRLVESNCI